MGLISGAWNRYRNMVEFAGMRIDARALAVITIISAAVAGFLVHYFDPILSMLLALVILDLGFGIPFFLAGRKVEKIESSLPDVLHHMSTTLKTGGTVETALQEASRMDYGPVTRGLRRMLREIGEGSTFERSLKSFAERSRSKLLQKTSLIIIAARKSGGSLVDTLSAISDDIRSLKRLKSERKTETLLQFMFIIVSGCFVAPMVFGIVKSVLAILVGVGGTSAGGAALIAKYDLIFKAYLGMESALSTLGAVQVREGNFSKAVLYIPILVLVTYTIYVVVSSQFISMIAGASEGSFSAALLLF